MRGSGGRLRHRHLPQCYRQYDAGQMMAARKLGVLLKTPVLFYLQLLGFAMSRSLGDMRYGSHRVRDAGFEEKVRGMLGA